MLTCSKKRDRATMGARIVDLCNEMGATAVVRDDATHIWEDGSRPSPEYRNRLVISIAADDLRVTVTLDGNRGARDPNTFQLAWNVALDSEKRLSPRFGAIVGGEVNPFHRRKCGAWAEGFDDLLIAIGDALACVIDGDAFLAAGEFPAPSGHTWDRGKLEGQGFTAVGDPTPCQIGVSSLDAIARLANVAAEHLIAFRLNDGSWQAFRRPA